MSKLREFVWRQLMPLLALVALIVDCALTFTWPVESWHLAGFVAGTLSGFATGTMVGFTAGMLGGLLFVSVLIVTFCRICECEVACRIRVTVWIGAMLRRFRGFVAVSGGQISRWTVTGVLVVASMAAVPFVAAPNSRLISIVILVQLAIVICGRLLRTSPPSDKSQPQLFILRLQEGLVIHPFAALAATLVPMIVWLGTAAQAVVSPAAAAFALVGLMALGLSVQAIDCAKRSQFPPAVEVSRAFGGGVHRLHVQPHAWLGLLAIISLCVWLAMAYSLSLRSPATALGSPSTTDQPADDSAALPDSGVSPRDDQRPPEQHDAV